MEEEDDNIAAVMGFATFGKCTLHSMSKSARTTLNIVTSPTLGAGKKAAMKFDVDKIFEETRRTAKEYSEQASGECNL